jgi:hypothetical protein
LLQMSIPIAIAAAYVEEEKNQDISLKRNM